MSTERESNNTLYFLVGGLLVMAAVLGFALWGPDMSSNPADINPSAGSSYSTTTTTDTTSDPVTGESTTIHREDTTRTTEE